MIVVLEKTLESPLDCKDVKLVNPKGNSPWLFIGRADIEVEALNHSLFQYPVQNTWDWIYIPPLDFDLTPVICFIQQFISRHDTRMIIR